VSSLGHSPVLEYKVGGMTYDVGVPDKHLLIEYNGLRWHAMDDSKRRDTAKYRNAEANEWKLMVLYEDEWNRKQIQMKTLLAWRLGSGKPQWLRTKQCVLRHIENNEAAEFYDKHHYMGNPGGGRHYGVMFSGKLIACCSFKKPTRQSAHSWELVRMASDPNFGVRGVWSKLFSMFAAECSPTSVVSFSDDRLFEGKVYERLNFKKDGRIRPDYYWTKGGRRFHKSALRKHGAEKQSGLTETQLRQAQGYKKIWDLGKTRWVFPKSL
jgi:hypothetical protein